MSLQAGTGSMQLSALRRKMDQYQANGARLGYEQQ
jgi:hypothetical protein